MKLNEVIWRQLEREAPATRSVLQRVPEGRPDWKPHAKSMPLGYLASLVATMPSWVSLMVEHDALDLNPPGGQRYQMPVLHTTHELLEAVDRTMEQARDVLAKTTDDHLILPWQFKSGGRVLMEKPRYVMLQDALVHHLVHHRGQLTVYLRLNDALVPAVYGPSADEGIG